MSTEITRLENVSPTADIDANAVAIGFFDGVHFGHKKLLNQMQNFALSNKLKTVVFTFDNSPKQLLCPDLFKGYLTERNEKFSLLKKFNISKIVTTKFDLNFANINYKDFVKKILIDKLNANAVFVGYNFTFGSNREGNANLLKKELSNYGIKCFIVEQCKINGEAVSSSAIRATIEEGNFDKANLFLGREFAFGGTVEHGDARGRTMGFPTANLPLKDTFKVLPPNGVYACYTDTTTGTYPSVVNMGFRPTFDKDIHLLEAHLIDFSGNLYDQAIRVRFVKKLRPEIKFHSMDELIEQISTDKNATIKLLKI